MEYMIKSEVMAAIKEDRKDTLMWYQSDKQLNRIVRLCYENVKRAVEKLPQYRLENVEQEVPEHSVKKVINNGVEIPNECDCIWCGGKMKRGGANYMGAGVNQFAMFCDDCGAVLIQARDFGKKIKGFAVKYDVE